MPLACRPGILGAMAHLSRRHRKQPPPHPTEASKKLVHARTSTGLKALRVAAALGVHPRTLQRWEQGRTRPDAAAWSKVVAFYARHVPALAEQLAAAAGVPSPLAAPPPAELHEIEAAIVRAADDLDVSPRRVRLAVREILRALAAARGTAADLWRAVDAPLAEPGEGRERLASRA